MTWQVVTYQRYRLLCLTRVMSCGVDGEDLSGRARRAPGKNGGKIRKVARLGHKVRGLCGVAPQQGQSQGEVILSSATVRKRADQTDRSAEEITQRRPKPYARMVSVLDNDGTTVVHKPQGEVEWGWIGSSAGIHHHIEGLVRRQ